MNPGIINEALEEVSAADLVVASGGGFLTDVFGWHAYGVLSLLQLAISHGVPTAIFGQGVGPMHNPALIAKAKDVLPQVGLIGLRERRASKPLLSSIGVSMASIITTGDDAIELAYDARPPHAGGGLGINLRVAVYSPVDADVFETVRMAVHQFAHASSLSERSGLSVPAVVVQWWYE